MTQARPYAPRWEQDHSLLLCTRCLTALPDAAVIVALLCLHT
jgi:hypothetical protein